MRRRVSALLMILAVLLPATPVLAQILTMYASFSGSPTGKGGVPFPRGPG